MKTKNLIIVLIVAAALMAGVYAYIPSVWPWARMDVTGTASTDAIDGAANGATSDSRTLITSRELSAIDGTNGYLQIAAEIRDSGGPNLEAPTVQVPYENKALGISMLIPFNPAWGSKEYRLHPYEELSAVADAGTDGGSPLNLMFGPIFEGEGGGFGRGIWFRLEQKQSAADVAAGYKAPYGSAVIKTIDGREIVEVIAKESCPAGFHFIVIPGETHNYHLSARCGGGFRDANGQMIPFDFEYLETVLKGIEVR